MEEAEIQDQDIKLQRVAPDFISELHKILPSAPYENQTGQVRTYISEKTTSRVVQLVCTYGHLDIKILSLNSCADASHISRSTISKNGLNY